MSDDYFRFENKEYDIPFYNGKPPLNSSQTLLLFAGLILTFCITFVKINELSIIKAALSFLIPMICVWYALNGDLSTIFRKLEKHDVIIIILALIANFIIAIISGVISSCLGASPHTNPAFFGIPFVKILTTIIQLVGEELFKFIALVLTMIYTYKYVGRRASIIMAVIVSQLIFGFAHISAYGLDIIHLVISISLGSIILPITYVKTKNILIPYLVHLIYDLILIVPVLFGIIPI